MELLSVVTVVIGSEVLDQGYSFQEELSASFDHTESDKGQMRVSGIWGEKKTTYSDILCPVPWTSLGVTFLEFSIRQSGITRYRETKPDVDNAHVPS